MPLQKVTGELDIPEGREACKLVGSVVIDTNPRGEEYMVCRLYLRKLPDPVEEWLAAHPWLPEGRWVYRDNGGYWWITDRQPEPRRNGYDAIDSSFDFDVEEIAGVFGHTFTPPPVDCLQVKRTKPCN